MKLYMPKRNTRRRNKSRHGGNTIAAATQNLQSATNARVEKTKQQVTQAVDKAKIRAQLAVHRARTTAENTVATQINKAAAAVRPKLPPPTTVAKNAALDIITPVHHAINYGAHAVRKVIARTPGVSAHRVAPAAHQAHIAANHALHKQQILHAAQKQHNALVAAAAHRTTPRAGLVAPLAGGSRKRRKRRRRHRRHRTRRRRTRHRRRKTRHRRRKRH